MVANTSSEAVNGAIKNTRGLFELAKAHVEQGTGRKVLPGALFHTMADILTDRA
jgi:hypothetical protein